MVEKQQIKGILISTRFKARLCSTAASSLSCIDTITTTTTTFVRSLLNHVSLAWRLGSTRHGPSSQIASTTAELTRMGESLPEQVHAISLRIALPAKHYVGTRPDQP